MVDKKCNSEKIDVFYEKTFLVDSSVDSLVVVPFDSAGLGFEVGSDYSSLALVPVELAKTKFPFF